jgi:hypothetical protein
MAANTAIWESHDWASRELALDLGAPLVQHTCRRCGRNFVDELRTGKHYAVYVGAVNFDRLSDEVTLRWLSDQCPGERLESDKADLATHFRLSRMRPDEIPLLESTRRTAAEPPTDADR